MAFSEKRKVEFIMKEGDNPNPLEQATGNLSSHTGQTIDSENSSGSVYQSPIAVLEGDGGLTTHHIPSTVSESDSAEHFSDAIQESDDTASVYSAEEIPQQEDCTIQVLVSKSSLHQWSASASKVSILQNDDANSHSTPSRIPLPSREVEPRIPGSQSANSFQFEHIVRTSEGSQIPVPSWIKDSLHGQNLRGSKSEPKIQSTPSSPNLEQSIHQETTPNRNLPEAYPPEELVVEDLLSSESENITAISTQANNDDTGLEKFRSEDLLEDSGIPFDSPDPVVHIVLSDLPDASQLQPSAPPLSLSEEKDKDQSEALDDADFHTITSYGPESEVSEGLHLERSPSYTVISHSSQVFDVSQAEEPVDNQEAPVAPKPPSNATVPLDVKTEKIEIIELERAREAESLPAPPVESLQVDLGNLIAMGQANARETVAISVDRVDSPTNCREIAEGTSLKSLPSVEEPYDDDYIDEPTEPSKSKKVSRFEKLKNKLQRRTSSKEVSLKKTGSSAKPTLKVRRKLSKAPSSRPASAKRPITPPMTTAPTTIRPKGTPGVSHFSSVRASIKQEVEKMKQSGKLELDGLKERSSSDIAIRNEAPESSKLDLKAPVTSNHSIRDIFQDQAATGSKENSKDPTPKSPKTSRDEDNVVPVVLSSSNQTKLNSLTSRYRVQMRKYNRQFADLTDLQNKTGSLHESLAQLKTQIISMAGGMPTSLNDAPAPIVMAAKMASEHREEPNTGSLLIEEMTSENENLKTEIGRLHSNMNIVYRENKQIKEEVSSVKEQLATAKRQVTDLLKANEERLQGLENMKLETQKSKRVSDTYKRKLDEIQRSSHEAKVKHEEERSRRMEHEKALIAEVNALKNKLQMEATKREYAQHALTNLNDEKETLEIQNRGLTQANNDLQLQLVDQKQEIEKARRVQDEYNLLQVNVNKLETELNDSQKYCDALASRIDSSEKAEEETSKRLIQLSQELLEKMNQIQKLTEQQRFEQTKRTDLYKIISNLSSLMGLEVEYKELATASDKEKCENTQLIMKICSDFERVLRNKDAEIEKQRQQNADLQSLHQEKQKLIEQLYEFVNEKNASICKRSSSSGGVDNKEEEKNSERSTGLNIEECGTTKPPDFQELYSMLEVKRHTLLRMESQIRSLQGVHAHCGMRRTMQESRIAELETMLANCLD